MSKEVTYAIFREPNPIPAGRAIGIHYLYSATLGKIGQNGPCIIRGNPDLYAVTQFVRRHALSKGFQLKIEWGWED